MANTSSAKKRTRVIERKTKIREMQKSKIKSLIKNVESSISQKDQKTAMEQDLYNQSFHLRIKVLYG